MDESESVNTQSAIVVRELLIMRLTRKASENIEHWSRLAEIEIIERNFLVLIGCDVLLAGWVLEESVGRIKSPTQCALC